MSNVFNKPNRKAKRIKKTSFCVSMRSVFVKVRDKYPQYKHKVTETECRDVINNFTFYMKNKILENRDGIELPENLGYIMITAFKSKKKLLNKKESEKHGIKIYETNLSTDGFKAKILYSNDKMKFKLANRDVWSFRGTSILRKEVSHIFKENWKSFIQLNMIKKISYAIEGNNIKHIPLFDPESTYNEFDI